MKASPDEVLRELLEGNRRFIEDRLEHPNRCSETKEKAVLSQSPVAIILGCSDSRVPVEIVFDQGIGDLFVIRVAGNILCESQKESILFALDAFAPSVIMVLGHENCGAIAAARSGAVASIPSIFAHLSKEVATVSTTHEAVVVNVKHVVRELQKVERIEALLAKKKIQVVGAVYELLTGKVMLTE